MLRQLGFSSPLYIESRATIADLFKPPKRCGIYVLHFANGEYYVGQAVDITRRYLQHLAVHKDIVKISFMPVRREELNETERATIWSLEHAGWLLRNITFTSIPQGESDFDLIMPVDQQERWLIQPSSLDNQGERLINPDLRRKYQRRFNSFSTTPHFNRIVEILKVYANLGLPVACKSEISFWAISCFPASHVYCRININWQEVFTAFRDDENNLKISVHLAYSPLIGCFDFNPNKTSRKRPSIEHIGHQYEPGGQDQTSFEILAEEAKTFIENPCVGKAIRTLNLRLMKKGLCVYGRYHCLALADSFIFS